MTREEYDAILKRKAEIKRKINEMEHQYPNIKFEAILMIAEEWLESLKEFGLPENCGMWEA